MLDIVLITLVSVIAAQALPGPSLFAVVSAAVGQDRRAALLVASGVSTGILIWALAVASGLGMILQTHPKMLTLLKLLGGSYLFWLGIRSFWIAWRGDLLSLGAGHLERSAWASFRYGTIIVLTNPSAALMWVGVASFLFGSGFPAWQVAALSAIVALAALLLYAGYGMLFSTGISVELYRRFWRIAELAFAGLFGALGASLFIGGLREIRET